jgi:hypothetical protein
VASASFRNSEATIRIPRDLRGQWVSAATEAAFIYDFDEAASTTSEVGEPVQVQ